MRPPLLSVVVVTYNMYRELPRTLASLAPGYQVGIDAADYEVIVVDNGSTVPPSADDFAHLGLNLSVLTTPDATVSPAPAVNRGLNMAAGSAIGVFIDGARLASPGLLAAAGDALSLSPRAVVGSRGRYLGYGPQRDTIAEGYDQTAEDALLASVDWPADGYRLFTVSVFDESSGPTWLDAMAESNSLFMWRDLWVELGGFDTGFTSPGGGLVNLDAWKRARALPDTLAVALVGEATFHQVHGGVATNGSDAAIATMFDEYETVRGEPFTIPTEPLAMWGTFVVEPTADELVTPAEVVDVSWLDDTRRRIGSRVGARLPTTVRTRLRRNYERLVPVVTGQRSQAAAARRAEDDDAALVASSGLFDARWYVATYPDVAEAGWDPVRHYLRFGVDQQRQPGPGFDAEWYRSTNLDVAKARVNPLVHYLRHGAGEGRWIRVLDPMAVPANHEAFDQAVAVVAASELFDPGWYCATYADAAGSDLDPAVHYLRHGRRRGFSPGPLFDAAGYLDDNPDVRVAGLDPLVHYETFGRAEGRHIHPVTVAMP